MRPSKPVFAALAALASLSLVTTASAQETVTVDNQDRGGIFGGFELALAQSNLEPVTDTDMAGLGAQIAFHLGYRFDSGLGFSGGVSGSAFGFKTQVGNQKLDTEVALDTLDASAWYFLDMGPSLSAPVRAGLLSTSATSAVDTSALGFGAVPQDPAAAAALTPRADDALGFILAVGMDIAARRHMRVFGDLALRWLGTSFEDLEGMDDTHTIIGLSVGVGWMP